MVERELIYSEKLYSLIVNTYVLVPHLDSYPRSNT